MPNRVIKDSINESEGLSECSVFAEDLFKRLITYADDYGRFNADTTIMRARLYPREYESVCEQDIIDGLIELVGIGKIAFYTPVIFNQYGKKGIYGAFPKWSEHQRIRDSKRKCPEPSDTSINDWYLRRFISVDMKAAVLERDGFKCRICGKYITSCKDAKRFIKLGSGLYHIDHIVPLQQGGRATLENLQLTCPECNLKRKKKFSFKELLDITINENEDLQKVAESCGNLPLESNPIQSESESENNMSELYGRIIAYLNEKTGKHFRVGTEVKRLINARLNAKATEQDFYTVIDNMTSRWKGDKKMDEYLRPITLFGTKFDSYLNAGIKENYAAKLPVYDTSQNKDLTPEEEEELLKLMRRNSE